MIDIIKSGSGQDHPIEIAIEIGYKDIPRISDFDVEVDYRYFSSEPP